MPVKKSRINLLPKEEIVSAKIKSLRSVSFVVLGIYLFLLVVLFAVVFVFSNKQKDLQLKQDVLTHEVDQLKDSEGMLGLLKDRVNLTKLTFSKASPVETMNTLIDVVNTTNGVRIKSIDSKEADGSLGAAVEAQDSQSMKELLLKLKGKQLVNVVLNSATFDSTNSVYLLMFSVQ